MDTARQLISGASPLSCGLRARKTSMAPTAAPATTARPRAAAVGRRCRSASLSPLPALTAITATMASPIPATPITFSRSPSASPTAAGTTADTTAVTGDSTPIGPMARLWYNSANPTAEVTPASAPQPSAAADHLPLTSGSNSTSTIRLTGAVTTSTRSIVSRREARPPTKSATP